MPLPLGSDYFKLLEVKPTTSLPGASLHQSPGRLELRGFADGQPTVTFGATIEFLARPQEPAPPGSVLASLPDRDIYLAPREGLIHVSDYVRETAMKLAPDRVPPMEAARIFWDFIWSESKGSVAYDQIDPDYPCDWILQNRRFDCQMRAVPFIALCRGRGIPARQIGGYVLHLRGLAKHYWTELWIDGQGWVPFDFNSQGRDLATPEGRAYHYRFFGKADRRLTCERLPREFTGALGIPLPKAWLLTQINRDGGLQIQLASLDGSPLYSDWSRYL
jgi:hypothetical protein